MQRNPAEQQKFFDQLVTIKDDICKQIPLAANRFEEFECPPIEENDRDIDIQFHMHEAMQLLMYVHYSTIDVLHEAYREFAEKHDFKTSMRPPSHVCSKMSMFLATRTNAVYSKVERIWKLKEKKFDAIAFGENKEQILKVIQTIIADLCDKGDSALKFDEDYLIELHIQGLRQRTEALTSKLRKGIPVTDEELSLVDMYRREGVPHEEVVNQLFTEVNFNKHFPKSMKPLSEVAILVFHNDVMLNIDRLASKLRLRQHTYAKRYEYKNKLADIRDTMLSNLLITNIDSLLKSAQWKDIKDKDIEEVEKKSLASVAKSTHIQRGLYYDLQKIDSGFCDEHACLALVKSLGVCIANEARIEKVSITYLDEDGHTFLVIDRDENSELNDMATWGEKAILLDAWHQLVCYAKDIDKQPKQYRSFPKGPTWSSIEFTKKDTAVLWQLSNMFNIFTKTDNVDPEKRECRLIEEYALKEIDESSMLMRYFFDIVERHRPADFKYHLKFYITSIGNDLVKYIPGFREPVVAIHEAVITLLADKKLSLTAFEFSIVTVLMQLKMYTSFISPLSISHESQQHIDMTVMGMIKSTDASIEYLRAAAEFNKQTTKPLFTVDYYERSFGGFSLRYVTNFSYAERIKILQASIAGGIAKTYTSEIEYPSPVFQTSLKRLSANKIEEPLIIKVKEVPVSVSAPSQTTTTAQTPTPTPTSKKPAQTTTIPKTATQQRIKTLNQLIQQLPELMIELLPYEEYRAPSIRLRQYCQIVESLAIDYNNESEAALVDQLIDQAEQMQMPGFEYLYYAFASRWGVSNIGVINLEFLKNGSTEYSINTYYLVRSGSNTYDLFYVDADKVKHPIDLNQIEGMKECLSTLAPDKDPDFDSLKNIEFFIHQYQGLRQLGLFKSIQKAITAFVSSTSFDEALRRASEFAELRKKYSHHLDDESFEDRRWQSRQKSESKDDEKAVPATRFYGTNLGRFIKWFGFDLSDSKSAENPPFERFIAWARKDSSKLIAETLFRLGLSNHANVVIELDKEFLKKISTVITFSDLVYYGCMSGIHKHLFRLHTFSHLINWVAECKSKAHKLDDSMLTDSALLFEEAFVRYFDTNLPMLVSPNYEFNKENDAQTRLLKEFYRVALKGNEIEKAVVKSFFFGREDKRDLSALLNGMTLGFHSNYSKFVCLQSLDGNPHHLFDDYDIAKLIELNIINIYSNDKDNIITLDNFRVFLRAPEAPSLDSLLFSLLDVCVKKNLNLKNIIIRRYLIEVGQLTMFSEPVIKILSVFETYLPDAVRKALNNAKWPLIDNALWQKLSLDLLIRYYTIFDFYSVFPSRELKIHFGKIILDRILALPAIEEKITLLEAWLFSNSNWKLPLSDIVLKNKLVDALVELYGLQFGKDDGSTKYYDDILPLIKKLFEKLFNRDSKLFMSKLLNTIEAQRRLSDLVGMRVDPGDYQLYSTKQYKKTRQALVTLIKAADLFSNDNVNQKALLEYFSTAFSQASIDEMLLHVQTHINVRKLSSVLGWSLYDYDDKRVDDKEKTDEKIRGLLMGLYYQFWDCSLHERAAIIEQVLIPASKTISVEMQTLAYEYGLAYITQKLFPNSSDTNSDDYLALCIMKSYLQTADPFERSYLLTAMLVSANEHAGQEATMGKKLAIVCEHMGPAYVKLAQAIHSHPKTSDEIRADLQHVKGRANPPYRWSLWRQIAEVLPPEDLAKIKRLGRLLGSASYNLVLKALLNDGSTVALLLLRENAEVTARKGFAHIRATINDCPHEAVLRQRTVMMQTIDEAARLSENEMAKEASDKQSRLAETLYPQSMEVRCSGKSVKMTIATARIIKSGLGYRFIDLMRGKAFNALPDVTANDGIIKKAVSKVALVMELHNIFRGGPFDSDRHGNQQNIQIERHEAIEDDSTLYLHIGLYDFGEMALESPKQQDLQQLADVLNRALIGLYHNKTIDQVISERIDLATEIGESTHYLMRLRKAFLALHDFHKYLDKEDLIDVLKLVASKQDLHPILKWPVLRLASASSVIFNAHQAAISVSTGISQFGIFIRDKVIEMQKSLEADQTNALNHKK